MAFVPRAVSCICVAIAALPAISEAQTCELAPAETARVAALVDARSIRLADGREVKLAGLELPFAPTIAPAALQSARRFAEALLAGREVSLRMVTNETDRYGRRAALVFINGSETPVQYTLLAAGQARLFPDIDSACLPPLQARERLAREARLGLWGDPGYALREAADAAAIRADLGRFSVAEGRVASVRESGNTIYVNFGRRWRDALTATISKRDRRLFVQAGLEPKQLEGRIIRVRGHVELLRDGPVIAVIRPEQIEIGERN